MPDLRQLTSLFPRNGLIDAIVLRPARGAQAITVASALALKDQGLEGDRSAKAAPRRTGGHKRQVTLIQAEHLPIIAAWIGRERIEPIDLRRNLVISGVNLLAARTLFADQATHIAIGEQVVLVATGPCDPCSKMEAELGPGAYNAMRGHGGITARVVAGGKIKAGDTVRVFCDQTAL